MNEISSYNQQLPDTLEDLSRFVLINEERIQALKAEIRAIKKVSLAKEVYEQKLAEAQEIGQITVEAAQKMGELLLQIQKQSGNQYTNASSSNVEKAKTKTEITSEMGMSKDQVSQYQQMAQNPEAVQAAIQKAIENGDVVSRSQVMKEIRSAKEELQEQLKEKERKIKELENRPPQIKEVVREVAPSDYREVKSKAKAYDAESKHYEEKLKKAYDEKNKLQDEIKEMQQMMNESHMHTDIKVDALYFCHQCKAFLQDVAGYVWITDKLEELSDVDRKGYIQGAIAVRDWATVLLQNIERNEEYGKPELQRIIEERTIN